MVSKYTCMDGPPIFSLAMKRSNFIRPSRGEAAFFPPWETRSRRLNRSDMPWEHMHEEETVQEPPENEWPQKGVGRPGMFFKKAINALVKFQHGSKDVFIAADPCKMNDGRPWKINHLPPVLPHTPAPVRIFPVHEEPGIQGAHMFYGFSSHHHTGP